LEAQNTDTTFCVSGILDAGTTAWNDTYIWNTNEETQQIEVTESGMYEVFAKNECTEAVSQFNVKVETLEEGVNDYNIITPNNDGMNDLFTIYEGDSEQYELHIYNRWGKLVWQTTDPTHHWDGKGVSDGSYFYHLTFINCAGETIEKRGMVTVLK
jgi:gliding motility-associated-like protein